MSERRENRVEPTEQPDLQQRIDELELQLQFANDDLENFRLDILESRKAKYHQIIYGTIARWTPVRIKDTGAVVMQVYADGEFVKCEDMSKRVAELEISKARYETIRKLSAKQFANLYKLNISTSKPFDQLVDELAPFFARRQP